MLKQIVTHPDEEDLHNFVILIQVDLRLLHNMVPLCNKDVVSLLQSYCKGWLPLLLKDILHVRLVLLKLHCEVVFDVEKQPYKHQCMVELSAYSDYPDALTLAVSLTYDLQDIYDKCRNELPILAFQL